MTRPRQTARTIAITSGKGGVGKSCIAVALGCELGRAGKRVLIIDADLGLANLDILLNLRPKGTLHDVLHDKCKLADVLLEGPTGVTVLPAGSGIAEHTRLSGDLRLRLPEIVGSLVPEFDYLLFDTGAGIAEVVLYASSLAQEVLIVATPEPTSFADAYAMMKVMALQQGRERFGLVVNQLHKGQDGGGIARKLQQIADRFLPDQVAQRVALEFVGSIPADPAMERSVRARTPVVLHEPESPAAVALRALARAVSVQPPRLRGLRIVPERDIPVAAAT